MVIISYWLALLEAYKILLLHARYTRLVPRPLFKLVLVFVELSDGEHL